MKNIPEIELFNSISKTHNQLYFFEKELKNHFPNLSFRFDLSMYSANRKEWPGSPIGITWEINIDELNEVFFFEITQQDKWCISSELSKVGPETIETYFDLECDEVADLIRELPNLLYQFQMHCKRHLTHLTQPNTSTAGSGQLAK